MMKTRRLMVIASLVLVTLLITTGVVFAVGRGAVNQGRNSTAEGDFSTVSGGRDNNIPATGDFATIGGGQNNTADRAHSTVGGGLDNAASGEWATAGGGRFNTASGDAATVSGGDENEASGNLAAIGGGHHNVASELGAIAGGEGNTTSGLAATVGGGGSNEASVDFATVGGGLGNTASGFASVVGGGSENHATASFATIAGGGTSVSDQEGRPIGPNLATDEFSTVSGGHDNQAGNANDNLEDASFATVGGGAGNTASGLASAVPGGNANIAGGDHSFAAGHRAQANHNGTFVWADDINKGFASTGKNQFLIRASGGVGIGTNNPTEQLTVNGKVLAQAFVRRSAAQWKTDIQTLEGSLEKVQSLRGVSYDWKADGKHDIGLLAEEVGKVIPEVVVYEENGKDAIGVDYAGLVPVLVEAIKEQQQFLEDRDAQIAALQEDNHEFKARIAALEESVGAKGAQTGLLPFNASLMWMLAGGLGLLLITPGLVLGYRRFRRDE
jgi:hypothetical protein